MPLIFFSLSTSALVCMMKSNKYRLSRTQTRTLKYVSTNGNGQIKIPTSNISIRVRGRCNCRKTISSSSLVSRHIYLYISKVHNYMICISLIFLVNIIINSADCEKVCVPYTCMDGTTYKLV